jgi:hypothetical protein
MIFKTASFCAQGDSYSMLHDSFFSAFDSIVLALLHCASELQINVLDMIQQWDTQT